MSEIHIVIDSNLEIDRIAEAISRYIESEFVDRGGRWTDISEIIVIGISTQNMPRQLRNTEASFEERDKVRVIKLLNTLLHQKILAELYGDIFHIVKDSFVFLSNADISADRFRTKVLNISLLNDKIETYERNIINFYEKDAGYFMSKSIKTELKQATEARFDSLIISVTNIEDKLMTLKSLDDTLKSINDKVSKIATDDQGVGIQAKLDLLKKAKP
jgi:hypothetical protein